MSWRDVDVEVLRTFMKGVVLELGLRRAADMIGRGHEQVRKFIKGEIRWPQDKTRRAMAELFLRHQPPDETATSPSTSMAEERPVPRLTSPELRSILPDGLEAASAVVRAIFALARRHPDELPAEAAALEKLLLRQLKEEYREVGAYVLPAASRKPRPPAEPSE